MDCSGVGLVNGVCFAVVVLGLGGREGCGGRSIGFVDYTDNIINNFKVVSKLCHFWFVCTCPCVCH